MSKCSSQKARKQYKCSKCGSTIEKGVDYFKIVARFAASKIRCAACRPRQSELTSSDKLSRVYAVVESFEDCIIDEKSDAENAVSILEDSADEIGEVADDYEEGASNIEEGFSHATSQSDEMREKADMLRDWQNEIQNAQSEIEALLNDWEDVNDEERNNILIEAQAFLSDCASNCPL